ncbi:MAG: hypothetical protein ACRD2B_00350 [Terriglobia bacterium]
MRKRHYAIPLIAVTCSLLLCYQTASAAHGPAQNTHAKPGARRKKKKLRGLLEHVQTRGVISAEIAPPLTTTGKFKLAVSEFANPFTVVTAAVTAQYYRVTEPREKIGYGASGYGKQLGAAYLDDVSGNMFSMFIYPSLLHQDPRYYRKVQGSIESRVLYSVSRVFVTRGDSAQKEINWSQILGSASSTLVSTTYYPRRARRFRIITGNVGWALLGDAGTNVFNEFWPDFARWLNRKL